MELLELLRINAKLVKISNFRIFLKLPHGSESTDYQIPLR